MPWFAAHVIMYFKRRHVAQPDFAVWENVHLIEAQDDQGAWALAEDIGRRTAANDASLYERDGGDAFPVVQLFAGVRKVVSVSHENGGDRIGCGDEVTYSEFVVGTEEAVRRLAAGEDVPLTYTNR